MTPGSIQRFLRRLMLAFLLIALSLASPAFADSLRDVTPQNLTDAQVVAAISRSMDFLIKDVDQKIVTIKKLPDSKRSDPKLLPDPGELMLETYALLYIGGGMRDVRLQIHQDRMKILIDILLHADFNDTYHTSLQTLALAQLPQTNEVRTAINRTATKLINGRGKAGGYSYLLDGSQKDAHDQSNGQYGLLGVWGAADWGVVVPINYWKSTDEFWRAIQSPSGGWGYSPNLGPEPTPSMTAAGVASLFVCDEFLNRVPRLEPRANGAIERGLAALVTDFNPDSSDLYYLYSLERAGLASGAKFFGKHDWYRQIAANLVKAQQDNGSFNASLHNSNAVRASCYAILILGRGRAPVLMNKLQYNGYWNARSRDSANLHAFLAKTYERHLNWQTVPLSTFPEDWLDAPVLLITGSKDPNFTSDDVAKLRQFVNYGGMIFSVADGESKEFSEAMAKYASQMISADRQPSPNFEFRQLPADHPLLNIMATSPNPPKLLGISNGVRELWIHSPHDYGAVWQTNARPAEGEAWEVPSDVLLYMSGKEGLRSKLQPLTVPAAPKPPDRKVTIARLQYADNWDPEPGAWPRLARLMALYANTTVVIKNVGITALPGMAEMPAMAHLAGTGKLTLSPEEQAALRDYVNAGGTLFVEAIGGKEEFANSAADALKTIFPEGRLKVVPQDYILYTGTFCPDTIALHDVEYRRFWSKDHGNLTAPRIQYMTLLDPKTQKKRASVFFTTEDVTSGLMGTNTWAIGGYSPDSSLAIARNLVLYSWRNAPKKPSPSH